MAAVLRDIFRAIHEKKWLSVEYANAQGEITRYWCGIVSLDPLARRLEVDGLHLKTHVMKRLTLRLDAIREATVIDSSYHTTSPALIEAIESDPRYQELFGTIANLKILDYLYSCAILNECPELDDFGLVTAVDDESAAMGAVQLTDGQFAELVKILQGDTRRKRRGSGQGVQGSTAFFGQIAMNELSVRTKRGIYVLAYRELRLDAAKRVLAIGKNIVLCREFCVRAGRVEDRQSIRSYLDEDAMALLDDFEGNAEAIRDCVTERLGTAALVDDMPHVFRIVRNAPTYLQGEYDGIVHMCEEGTEPTPIKAFFGNLTRPARRRKELPLSLVNERVNLDQLLAINQMAKYPLTYVQGPPGTGKTTMIENAIVNAYCNGQTVLFCSYNNHPVDGVYNTLTSLAHDGRTIRFPILRLGSRQRTIEALATIEELIDRVPVGAPERRPALAASDEAKERAGRLTRLLSDYERRIDLTERRECISTLADTAKNPAFAINLTGVQLDEIDRELAQIEDVDAMYECAQGLAHGDREALMDFIEASADSRIRQLRQPRFEELRAIIESDDADGERVKRFESYLADPKKLKDLLRVFPVIATTCISARRLAEPAPLFDITIIDEASQCDTATALIPIARARRLALVGDPQQLNPVVTLDESDNQALRRTYQVGDEYDYIKNSVYKCFLAADSVSNEILLHLHYRCDEQIIGFNNQKYYANRLEVRSGRHGADALELIDVGPSTTAVKNAAPAEAEAICRYALEHPDERIGVITPFANQRKVIEDTLRSRGVINASVGTVHAFQGDEKNVVLFSLGLTDRTRPGTYRWLTENAELINVATSRARDKLVLVSSKRELARLHATCDGTDDIFDLASYVDSKGTCTVDPRPASSRALGVKPYSTQTEAAFLECLQHALSTIFLGGARHVVRHEVPIASVLAEEHPAEHLFFSGRFDFVVFEVAPDRSEVPVLAVELDGAEHASDATVARRDREKERICARHRLTLIRVDNTYARRYHHVKGILTDFFKGR